MAFTIREGPRRKELSVDDDRHRTYQVTYLLQTDDPLDGLYTAYNTSGLPVEGDAWQFGNESDVWAFCKATRKVRELGQDGPNFLVEIDFEFTTKPPETSRCSEESVTDPLLEPMKISGSFIKMMEEGVVDRFGRAIVSSSWERFRGQQNEWDANRPQVVIEQNVPSLQLEVFSWLVDCVNDRLMWGLPARCIKLSDATWDEKYYGKCYKYYTRKFTFDINRKGWDRRFLDEGTKVLKGHWTQNQHWEVERIDGELPNRFNPAHFVSFTDFNGQPITGVLNGFGLPAGVCIDGLGDEDSNIQDTFIMKEATSTGSPLDHYDFWVPYLPVSTGEVLGSPSTWNATTKYERGNTVSRTVSGSPRIYLALSDSLGEDPGLADSSNWVHLTGGLTDGGVFSDATTYTIGQYVVESAGTGTGGACNKTTPGYVDVQKYYQANLFLLSVPVIIGS
jgi:hypothetical protein